MSPNKLLLVIDDEEIVREAIKDILDLIQIEAMLARDGLEGLVLFQQYRNEIEAVLLDMKMPGLSGPDTLKQLRMIDPNIKVVLSSGYSELEARRLVSSQMPVDFLPKPYNLDMLVSKVQEIMGVESVNRQKPKSASSASFE